MMRHRPIALARGRRIVLGLLLVVGFSSAQRAEARTLFEEGELRLELRSAFKSSLLLSFPYQTDPVLAPDAASGAGLFRLRFDLTANLTEHFTAAVAYEHRARASSTGGTGAGLLPSTARAPFRLTQADWRVVDTAAGPGSQGGSYVHQHELDRFYLSLHLDFMELTVGRQALGLGRGVMFSAVDVFAPFTPTEIDREWRRGVDAVHLELRIPGVSAISGDVVAAFGDVTEGDLESHAILGRVRVLLGDVDASVLFGERGDDVMGAGIVSANLGDAEVHGEFAIFGTPGDGVDGGFLGTRAVVAKGLLGGSYVIDIGRGLRIAAEYHYSGFGVENIGDDPSILGDPAWQARFARGDSQILGRHALSLALGYDLADDLSANLAYIQSPVDGSGLVAPTVTWNYSDGVTVVLSGFIPWGTGPERGVPTSEYGAAPLTLFLQARLYD